MSDIKYCIVTMDLPIIIAVKSRLYCINANYISYEGLNAVARISTSNKMAISINIELRA
jgi:hypothetical protein